MPSVPSDAVLMTMFIVVPVVMVAALALMALWWVDRRNRWRTARAISPDAERKYIAKCFPENASDMVRDPMSIDAASATSAASPKVRPLMVKINFSRDEWRIQPRNLLRPKADWN